MSAFEAKRTHLQGAVRRASEDEKLVSVDGGLNVPLIEEPGDDLELEPANAQHVIRRVACDTSPDEASLSRDHVDPVSHLVVSRRGEDAHGEDG